MTTVVPLHDRVLVQHMDEALVSGGGIVLPQTARPKDHRRGRVIAVSEAIEKPKVKRGDIVIYYYHIEHMLQLVDGQQLFLIKESDLIARME
jgi:chaperonin GroES